MSDNDHGELETLSSYYTSTSDGQMMPSAKLVKQDLEREEAMTKIRVHREKALTAMEGNTILVCDSDIEDRLLISENLKRAGYLVFVAKDCKECEKILRSIPIKAVIVDTKFQGLEIIRKVNGSTKIILSGDPGISHVALPGAEHVAGALDAVAAIIEA
ncbi:hypothetical protein LCGC14_0966900 [marine sediment metagenome]|uniref:Response regulatory domain-containing protein n=1 Tax=marine sediment metagenome TaxID=412755 RepID=A0A0F9NHA9_9ZZZZ